MGRPAADSASVKIAPGSTKRFYSADGSARNRFMETGVQGRCELVLCAAALCRYVGCRVALPDVVDVSTVAKQLGLRVMPLPQRGPGVREVAEQIEMTPRSGSLRASEVLAAGRGRCGSDANHLMLMLKLRPKRSQPL
jgi:hypothetical protein